MEKALLKGFSFFKVKALKLQIIWSVNVRLVFFLAGEKTLHYVRRRLGVEMLYVTGKARLVS